MTLPTAGMDRSAPAHTRPKRLPAEVPGAPAAAQDEVKVDETSGRYATKQARWEAVAQRDAAAEGAFLYGVRTTGIYCRPACPSRLPRREHVRFFDDPAQAERAGYRPCKRCTPGAPARRVPGREAVLRACRLIEEAEEAPKLAALANAVGLSPSYLHRAFKRLVGLTPKQYAAEVRTARVCDALVESPTVTDAIYGAGFASSSRFYDRAAGALGMTPTTFRDRGRGTRIRYAVGQCALGWVLAAATDVGICAIDLGDRAEDLVDALRARFSEAEMVANDAAFEASMAQVLSYLDAPEQGLDLPLDIRGTAFQRRVWLALREIAPGETASYGEIAARIGQPEAARAVAQACAANPVAVVVPCHRVVRADGGLGGYRWGRERKKLLLERAGRPERRP